MSSGKIEIVGRDAVKELLRRVPSQLVAPTGLPDVVSAMMSPYVKLMRQFLTPNVRSGLLRKSIAKKVTVYQHDCVAFGIVGPDRDVVGEVGTKTRRTVRPSKYAHLVNGGTRPHSLTVQDTGETELVAVRPKVQFGKERRAYFIERKVVRRLGPARGGRLHPGAKPYPFRDEAAAAGGAESLRAGESRLSKLLSALGLGPRKAA